MERKPFYMSTKINQDFDPPEIHISEIHLPEHIDVKKRSEDLAQFLSTFFLKAQQ